jgi:hypothetical protein
MVCFRYIIVNTIHKDKNKGDDDGDNNNNNNNNNNVLKKEAEKCLKIRTEHYKYSACGM